MLLPPAFLNAAELFLSKYAGYKDAIQKAENMKQYGIATYKVFKLNIDFDREKLIEQFPTARTFPQIKVDGISIGGWDQFKDIA